MSGQSYDAGHPGRAALLPRVRPRVLVVDDEPSNIRVLAGALDNDYDVLVATGAREALTLLESGERPHLMLLDIMMPDMNGLELCRAVKARQDFQHIPIIFLTAMVDLSSEEEGFEAGAVDYIHKPIRIPSVRARVRTHLSLKGMLDHMLELNDRLNTQLHELEQIRWRLKQERRKLSRAEASKNLFERVFMTTSEGIALLDSQGYVTSVNASFCRITGYQEEEVVGRYHEVLDGLAGRADERERILEHLRTHDHWSGELYNRRKSGEVYPELRTISSIRADDGEVTHYVTVFNDITNLKETEQRLEELTWRDPVTALPNRALFLDQLGTVLKFCHRGNVATAVMVVDINNFRYINETYGFESGDRVIRAVAERLGRACFEDDSIARLSGDEFGIVLAPKRWSLDEAYRVAIRLFSRIEENLAEPIEYSNGHRAKVEVTAGIALYPTDSSDTPSLALRHAETAHRSAKNDGRSLAVFEDTMSEQIRRQLVVESELEQAIARDEIVLYGQSQFFPDRTLSGVEILVRWEHPSRGLLGPGEFIPFAERTRQIVTLERHIIRKTLATLADLEATPNCSINISARHLAEEDFADTIVSLVRDSGYPPEKITLELTESVMVSDVDTVIAKMNAINAIGCSFSLDDFGTGYSSLSQLNRLPISEIKIDRSFVMAALDDTTAEGIVEMVKRIGESMGVRVIAEGVETEAHAKFLRTHHPRVCLQGYYFGYPQPITALFPAE